MLIRKKFSLLFSFFLFVLSLFTSQSIARKFYFSTSGNDSYTTTQAQNPNTPWKTLIKLESFGNSGFALAGDTFAFKRGDVFINGRDDYGSLKWWANNGYVCPSGTAQNPIVFTNYGSGPLPNFLFPNPSVKIGSNRIVLAFNGVKYIIIDGLQFNDYRFPINDKVSTAYTAMGILLGEEGTNSMVSNSVIKNCEFNNIGYGISTCGNYNKIINNKFTNLKNVGDTSGTYDSGASPLILQSGKFNLVQNNYMKGGWAFSGSTASGVGLNGVGIEIMNNFDSSKIIYNTIIDCAGAFEIGNITGIITIGCDNDTFAYNKIINTGVICYTSTTGVFTSNSSNLKFWNNVFVENENSRFSGTKFGLDVYNDGQSFASFTNWPSYPKNPSVYNYGGMRILQYSSEINLTKDTIYDSRNNVFWMANNNQAIYDTSRRKFFHANNIYHIIGRSILGGLLNSGNKLEISTREKIFLDTSNVNPDLWDFHLNNASAAINFGRYTGINNDFDNIQISGNPDAGIYEYSSALLSAPLAPLSILSSTLMLNNCGETVYRFTAPSLPLSTSNNAAATGYVWALTTSSTGSRMILDSGTLNSSTIVVRYFNNNTTNVGDSIKLSYSSDRGLSAVKSTIYPRPVTYVPLAPVSLTSELVSDVCGARVYRYRVSELTATTNLPYSGATGYAWTLPYGILGSTGVLDSGSLSSQTIRIKYSSNAAAVIGDSIKVSYTSSCGNSIPKAIKLINTSLSSPLVPATLTSTLLVNNCGEKVCRYVAPSLTGATTTFAAATGYRWSFNISTLGSRVVLDSGSINGQAIIVRYFNSSLVNIGDSISVGYTSACGNSVNRTMIFPNPAANPAFAPTSITAEVVSDICSQRIYRYSVPSLPIVSNLSFTAPNGYAWSLPIGMVGSTGLLDSGSLSSQTIRIKYSSNAEASAGDSIKVAYTSSCGNSIALPMKLSNMLINNSSAQLSAPTAIVQTLVSNYCGERIYRYTTTASLSNNIVYSWIMPTGAVGLTGVLDSGSLSSQTIRIKYSSNAVAATGDSIKVAYTSSCATGAFKAAKLINEVLTVPIAPAYISSVLLVNNCGEKVYRYTTPAFVAPAKGYVWTMAIASNATATIDSGSVNGQVLIVRYRNASSSFIGDSIKVAYTSDCGVGASRSMIYPNPTILVPFTPASLTAELVSDVCGARVYRYKAPVLPGVSNLSFTAPTGYAWSMPIGSVGSTGILDSGILGSQVIRIMYSSNAAAAAIGDSIKLAFTSTCGNSANKVIRLTNVAKTGCLIIRNAKQINQSSIETKTSKSTQMMVNVYPNPTTSQFNIQVKSSNAEAAVIRVLDFTGRFIKTVKVSSNSNANMGSDLKAGAYMLEVKQGKEVKMLSVVKF